MENQLFNCLTTLIQKINKIESKNHQNNLKYLNWINSISSTEYTLISNLVLCFQDNLTDQSIKNQIIHILSLLLRYNYAQIKEQLSLNTSFHTSLTNYIDKSINNSKAIQTVLKPYSLLIQIYENDQYRNLNDETIINRLFTGLSFIFDQNTLEDIIAILTGINAIYKDNEENKVINIYKTNKNARIFNELLLMIYSKETKHNRKMKTLLMINTLIVQENNLIFYQSDFETFIDLLLDNLQNYTKDDHKYLMLHTIEKITQINEYYNLQYKIEDIIELMDDIKSSNEYQPEQIKKTCRLIMINITQYLLSKGEIQ